MPDPLPRKPETIVALVLLAMSSGLVDAVVYMRHGHVFAYAMTGNLVLLGVALSSHEPHQMLAHLMPILGFACGVLFGKFLLRCFRPYALHTTLLLQMAVLTTAGLAASHFPSEALVIALAISGAVIITVIRRAGNINFNITFMTGNLRSVFEGAFDGLLPQSPSRPASHGTTQFLEVGLTCAGFLTGAAIGSLTLNQLQDHTFWIAGFSVFAAALLLRRVKTTNGVD